MAEIVSVNKKIHKINSDCVQEAHFKHKEAHFKHKQVKSKKMRKDMSCIH